MIEELPYSKAVSYKFRQVCTPIYPKTSALNSLARRSTHRDDMTVLPAEADGLLRAKDRITPTISALIPHDPREPPYRFIPPE